MRINIGNTTAYIDFDKIIYGERAFILMTNNEPFAYFERGTWILEEKEDNEYLLTPRFGKIL